MPKRSTQCGEIVAGAAGEALVCRWRERCRTFVTPVAPQETKRCDKFVVLMQHKARPPIRRQGAQPRFELRRRPVRLAHVVALEPGSQQRADHRDFARIVVLGGYDHQFHFKTGFEPQRYEGHRERNAR